MREEVRLGSLVVGNAARDAIHIAVAPVVAWENLKPGQHVGLNAEKEAASDKPHIGIVDPFLIQWPVKGQRFYLCLYPHTVVGLRHDWNHPAFVEAADRMESEQWLRRYAVRMNCYEKPDKAFSNLIEGLRKSDLFAHGTDLHGLYDLDNAEDLRFHAERYLGINIDWDRFIFGCSC